MYNVCNDHLPDYDNYEKDLTHQLTLLPFNTGAHKI